MCPQCVLSTGTIGRGFLARRAKVEHLLQVEWTRVLGDRCKALRDLRVAQPAFDPQLTLHVVSDSPARACKLTRGSGFVLAEEALKLRPDYAEAYNNIAAGHNAIGEWDEGIAAAERALQIKPDFAVARANLAYARAQKAGKTAR